MGEAACRGPRERHSPGPNLALNGPVCRFVSLAFSRGQHRHLVVSHMYRCRAELYSHVRRTGVPVPGTMPLHRLHRLSALHLRQVQGLPQLPALPQGCFGCRRSSLMQFCAVVTLLTFTLIMISIPSPPHSSIPGLKTFLFC